MSPNQEETNHIATRENSLKPGLIVLIVLDKSLQLEDERMKASNDTPRPGRSDQSWTTHSVIICSI